MRVRQIVLPLLYLGFFLGKSTVAAIPSTPSLSPHSRIFVDDFLEKDAECKRGGPFDYPRCQPGNWCVGNSPPLCKPHRKAGETCTGEYEVCNRWSICGSAGKCERVPSFATHYIPINGICKTSELQKGAARRCLPGLWCILGRCRRLVPCGHSCGLKWQVCRPGLRCNLIFLSGKRICTRASGNLEVLQEGDRCAAGGTPRCKIGLVCASRGDLRVCAKPHRLGMPCVAGSGMCETGRVCALSRDATKGRVCSVPMRKGMSCGDKFYVCVKGLVCKEVLDKAVCA